MHALFRWDDRLKYLCGQTLWEVEHAAVRRRSIGPVRSLTFGLGGGDIGGCRWVDWELARRGFIPKWADVTRDEDDSEHFDSSLFVEAVLSTDRRLRIGLPLD